MWYDTYFFSYGVARGKLFFPYVKNAIGDDSVKESKMLSSCPDTEKIVYLN